MYSLDEPIAIIKTSLITKFNINNVKLNLFESINISIILYDDNENPIGTKNILIEGDDYNNWIDNDNYILNYITNYLKNNLIS